jgi:hypothetical protein
MQYIPQLNQPSRGSCCRTCVLILQVRLKAQSSSYKQLFSALFSRFSWFWLIVAPLSFSSVSLTEAVTYPFSGTIVTVFDQPVAREEVQTTFTGSLIYDRILLKTFLNAPDIATYSSATIGIGFVTPSGQISPPAVYNARLRMDHNNAAAFFTVHAAGNFEIPFDFNGIAICDLMFQQIDNSANAPDGTDVITDLNLTNFPSDQLLVTQTLRGRTL